MKIKTVHKLLILVMVPLLAFLFESWINVKKVMEEKDILHIMGDNNQFFVASSELIHELQKERGRTSVFLSGGSRADMEAQRKATDERIKPFSQYLKDAHIDAKLVDYGKNVPGEIDGIRKMAEDKKSPKELVDAYSTLIDSLMNLETGVANAKTTRGLGKSFTSLIILETAKERAGQLRATMSGILTADKAISDEMLNRVLTFKSGLDANLDSKALTLSKETADKLKAFHKSESFKEVNRVFTILVGKSREGSFGVNPKEFFAVITRMIDELGDIRSTELNSVQKKLTVISGDVNSDFYWSLGIVIAATLITLVGSILLSRLITDPIDQLLAEFGRIKEEAVNGRLNVRGDALKIHFEFRGIIEGLNAILDAIISPLKASAGYMERISRGDIPEKITQEFKGDFNELKNNLNSSIDTINKLILDTRSLVKTAVEGKLEIRGDTSAHQGAYRELVQGMNEIIDALVGHLDNVPIPVVIMDKDLKLIFANKTTLNLLGTSPERIKGTSCRDSFRAEDCDTERCACSRALRTGSLVSAETIARPAGMELEIKYSGIPIKGLNGEIVGVMETVIDLTEAKKAHRLARKQADFQGREVDKLVVNLEKLANGNLDVDTAVGAHDKDTIAIAENFGKINQSLERCVGAIGSLINDVDNLAASAVEGNLSARADVKAHLGDYRLIVDGLNKILNTVLNPVNEAVKCLKAVADGDLTAYMSGNYKGDHATIKNSLNKTLEAINGILLQVYDTAAKLSAGSEQVSQSSRLLSDSATRQAASLEEISASMTQLSSQTRMNAENAGQADKLTVEVRNSAERGEEQMEKMVLAMKEINDAGQNIVKIIKVIDEIAFQTNLLALNAAVEAARAGKHGKGFAVVAEEVRNLAGRSAKAAKETTELIEGSLKKGLNGAQIANLSAESLKEIVSAVKKAADLVGEIAVASNEQAQGISQVNEGLGQIDMVTQQNTATAEENAAAGVELSDLAEHLTSLLSMFKLSNLEGEPVHAREKIGRIQSHVPGRAMLAAGHDSPDSGDEWE